MNDLERLRLEYRNEADEPHRDDWLPAAPPYIAALEVEVERLTERLAIRDAHIDAQKAQYERLLTGYGDLQRAFADSCVRSDALRARIPNPDDLRTILTWAPARSPEAARLRAALPREENT
jgi:hypothetical protein